MSRVEPKCHGMLAVQPQVMILGVPVLDAERSPFDHPGS